MTNFRLVPIDSILIGDRFRKDYGPIDELAADIAKLGLLHPLVIDENNHLLVGGRRLQALQKLGWREVPVQHLGQVQDLLRLEIELSENVSRKDLHPLERARLTRAIDDVKRTLYGDAMGRPKLVTNLPVNGDPAAPPSLEPAGWSLRRTAADMGVTHPVVMQDIELANAADIFPHISKLSSRSNMLREKDRIVEAIEADLDQRRRKEVYKQYESSFVCGDATSLISNLDSGSVDCIITDPPYGLDLAAGRFAARDSDNDEFDDSPVSALALLRSIAPECRRVLKPSGHLYAFFGANLWAESQAIWRSAGFDVRDVINIWFKTGHATGAADWDYSFAPSWEPFLFASNNERRLAFKHKNTFPFAAELGNSRHHPTQKPVELLRELIQLSTSYGELVFDPFAGVGSTLVAASQLRRRFYGFELNPRFHAIGLKRLVDEGKERSYTKKEEL